MSAFDTRDGLLNVSVIFPNGNSEPKIESFRRGRAFRSAAEQVIRKNLEALKSKGRCKELHYERT